MKKNNLYLLIIFVLSALIHSHGLNWGLPNWQRSLQVFGTKERISENSVKMIELRTSLYTKGKAFSDRESSFTKDEFQKYFTPHNQKPFETLTKDTVLDFSRGYLLGLVLSDEQQVINAMANIHPEKLDFDPDTNYTHGAFYYYSLGAVMLKGKILKVLNITSDISYYLLNPGEIAKIYMAARYFSFLFAVLCGILVFFIARGLFDGITGFVAGVIFTAMPLVLNYSHQVKPHVYGMFWMLLALLMCVRIIKQKDDSKYLLVSLFLGFSAATLLSNMSFAIMIPLAELFRRLKNNREISFKTVILPFLLVPVIYLILTPYVIFSFKRFYNAAILHNYVSYNYGKFGIKTAYLFLKSVFEFGNIWIIIPGLLFGIYSLFKSKLDEHRFFLSISMIFIVFVSFFMKHQGVFTVSLPFICILAAYGLISALRQNKLMKIATVIYMVPLLIILTAGILFYETTYVQIGNITNAGKWINENIPKNSKVGIPSGWALPGYFPAMSFLDYKIINFPIDETLLKEHTNSFPEYLVMPFVEVAKYGVIKDNYDELKSYKSRENMLGIPFTNAFIPTENIDIKVFKRKK
ncbi:MAG: hypothetical protein A2252_06145 [Elusimicrobia bacterium RIFOXYA2_FULL_39_19]|nr:MAG: hypothetical protein A2252_06145 [Elusimicrobia bacterium RIFOXYA2_FULL_39_19]